MKIIKKLFGCAVVVFVGMCLLGFLCLVFYDQLWILDSTYKMRHDPKTKAYVQNYTGIIFPDSVKWDRCYFDPAWDGFTTFCAKFTIPEKDFEELLPSDIDFERFNDDIHTNRSQTPSYYSHNKEYVERSLGIKKLENLEVLYYEHYNNNTWHSLFFWIDRANKRSDDRILVYIYSSGYGHRIGKIVPFPE